MRKYLCVFAGLLTFSALTFSGPLKKWHVFASWPEGVATWAVILTLFAIVEQTEQTSRATAAAEASVLTANKAIASQEASSKAQLRAYLGVTGTDVRRFLDGSMQPVIVLKNSGQTPAYNVTGYTGYVFFTYPIGPLGTPPPDVTKGVANVAAGMSQNIVMEKIPASNPHTRELGIEFALCVHGRYTYVDVFGDTHSTSFQLILGGPAAINFAADPGGISHAEMSMDSVGNVAD